MRLSEYTFENFICEADFLSTVRLEESEGSPCLAPRTYKGTTFTTGIVNL